MLRDDGCLSAALALRVSVFRKLETNAYDREISFDRAGSHSSYG